VRKIQWGESRHGLLVLGHMYSKDHVVCSQTLGQKGVDDFTMDCNKINHFNTDDINTSFYLFLTVEIEFWLYLIGMVRLDPHFP